MQLVERTIEATVRQIAGTTEGRSVHHELETTVVESSSRHPDPLFEPLCLRTLVLPNRVIMTALKQGYATEQGEVTKGSVGFHALRALGIWSHYHWGILRSS